MNSLTFRRASRVNSPAMNPKEKICIILTILNLLLLSVHGSLPNNEINSIARVAKQSSFPSSDSQNTKVSSNPDCRGDLTRICGKTPENLADLDALECVLNEKRNGVDEISDTCNHVLWLYRKEITEDTGFLKLSSSDCEEEFTKTTCWDTRQQEGSNLVNCLIENKDKVGKEKCLSWITRLEGVIFSDYEMIERFATKCSEDIVKTKCGRNDVIKNIQKLPHSQGKTIECLSSKIQELKDECAVEILRIAELQVDDFHLDRALYFACRNDREKFCSRVTAGNGRVYKCLLKHKQEVEMSTDCREQIYRRQRLGWQDYRASGIVYSCKNEIKKFRCRREASSTADKHVRLSQILLCLENAAHTGNEINGDCVEEMRQHRKALMQDFKVTPELLSACSTDRAKFCPNRGLNGKTIHCLMEHAQSRDPNERIADLCRATLEDLLKISDISGDWRVDPVLQQNCQQVVDRSTCAKLSPSRILDCLMNILTSDPSTGTDSSVMTDECETTLLQIQYFIARDFPMDSLLFEACRDDAKELCGAKSDWADSPGNMEPNRGPLVFSCLFRNIDGNADQPKKISSECSRRVKESMRQRAISVRLMPEIEDACLIELSDTCSGNTKDGEELRCLQDNLNDLGPTCRNVVANFTQDEMKNPTIDPYIWKYCRDLVERGCSDDKSDEEDILECLIDLKPEMKNKKCRASVEHLQLLRLKDIRFSPKFKAQCHEHVIRYCNNERPITAGKLVSCLSDIIRSDIVTENTPRVTKGCRKQVRYLVMSKLQIESDKGDPNSVYSVCSSYVQMYCSDIPRGGGKVLECLRQHINAITDEKCHKTLFKVEEEISIDSRLDFVLIKECESEIRTFCSSKSENILPCLKRNLNKEGFDESKCGKLVRGRLIDQNSDSRLNPTLLKSCRLDIPKFCNGIHAGEGRIIACLKKHFANSKSQLSLSCKEHIGSIIEDAARTDIRLDTTLYASCKQDIERACKPTSDNESDGGAVEECLKGLFQKGELKSVICKAEVAQLIQSTLVDIHVDPMLNRACAIDLMKLCDGIPPGEGRLIACLLNELDVEKEGKIAKLSPKCKNMLSKREEMFHLAGSAQKLESIQDLYSHVNESPHRNYFLIVGMTVVGVIFIFGLFCGRATKRKAASKNK